MLKHILFMFTTWLATKEARVLAVKICKYLATKTDNTMDDQFVAIVARKLGVLYETEKLHE